MASSAQAVAAPRETQVKTSRTISRLQRSTSEPIINMKAIRSEPTVELHDPVRDGRPPLALSSRGHDTVEGQLSAKAEDPVETALIALRRESNRSWAMLRRGCLDLLGKPAPSTSRASAAGARTFARKAAELSGLSHHEILSWLDAKGR